jgi:hypothetical protein
MARSNASRTRHDMRAADIVRLLARAGWEAEAGKGSHVVLRRAGDAPIPLSDPVSDGAWKQVERAVGMQIETLVHKRKGSTVSPNEWRTRIELAGEMHRAGFPMEFTLRHTGTWSLYFTQKFKPAMVQALGVDGVISKYGLNVQKTFGRRAADPVRAPGPVVQKVPPRAAGVAVAERSTDDVAGLLAVMSELRDETHALANGRADRAGAYAEKLRYVRRELEIVHRSLSAAVTGAESLLEQLAEFK